MWHKCKGETPEGDAIEQYLFVDFSASNNEVEYEAVIAELRLAKALQVRILIVFTDCKLVLDQINGHMLTKNEWMIAYKAVVLELLKNFQEASIVNIPREQNREANNLASEAFLSSSSLTRIIPIDVLSKPTIETSNYLDSYNILTGEDEWTTLFINFLTMGVLPEGQKKRPKSKLRLTTIAFTKVSCTSVEKRGLSN